MPRQCLKLVITVALLTTVTKITAEKRLLNFAVFVPLPDANNAPIFDKGHSIIPAVQLAVEQINNRTDILPSYDINILVRDSGCDKASTTAIGTVSVIRDLLPGRNGPLGFIGPACSEDSKFVISIFQNSFHLPVLYSGTTPYLSTNNENWPIAFGMVSSTAVLVETLIRIGSREEWNWENIAVLYDDSREHFQLTYDVLIRGLDKLSQRVGYTQRFSASQIPLDEITKKNTRLVVVISGKIPAQKLVCLAGQSLITSVYPIYQFIFIERSLDDFLEVSTTFQQLCSHDDASYQYDKDTMSRGLNGSIFLNQALNSVPSEVVTVSNHTVGQVKAQYRKKLAAYQETLNSNLSESSFAYPYYDAVWALALGLHRITLRPDPSINVLRGEIEKNTSFQGVSGWIDFNHRRHVSNTIHIFQVNNLKAIDRGTWNGSVLEYEPQTFVSDKFVTKPVVVHNALLILAMILATLLLISTLILQIVTIAYRDYSSVKASSVHLNHFIYLGCYLFVMAIVTNTVHHISPIANAHAMLCNVDVFSSIFAGCFIVSTVLVKLWRTYRIFIHVFKTARSHHYSLHNGTLAMIVLVLNLTQVLVSIPAMVASPFEDKILFVYDNSIWPPTKLIRSECTIHSVSYIVIPLLFLFSLALAAVFLATLNRSVKRKHFRTTKQVVMLIYILTILWAIGGSLLAIFYRLNFSENVTYSFHVCLVVATVALCQLMLIVPSLVPLMTGREGNRVTLYLQSVRRFVKLTPRNNA